jgi:hypothetical protein
MSAKFLSAGCPRLNRVIRTIQERLGGGRMPIVPFGSYDYVPVLGTTEVERLAYGNLRSETRAGILPLFELTRHRSAETLDTSVVLVQEAVDAPFLLDLDKRYAPPPYQSSHPANPAVEQQRVVRETAENDAYNAYLNGLLSPANGFENWRSMCARFENAVPVLQCTNIASQANAVLRQAALLSQGGNSICIRIGQTNFEALIAVAIQILATLPSSGQMLVIFDCGQGRRGIGDKVDWVVHCLNLLLSGLESDQVTGISIVCMSNSYPQMNHDGLRVVENYDRQIWLEAYQHFPFHFGDYAASSRSANLSAFLPRSFRATVVHTSNDYWIVHRHQNADDPQGWIEGSAVVMGHDQFEPIDSWTDGVIAAAAEGDVAGMDSPRPWHAARVAGHIDRQFRYSPPSEGFEDLLG